MRPPSLSRPLFAAALLLAATAATSVALGQPVRRATPGPQTAPAAGSPVSTATNQITALTVIPASPRPDQPFRVRVDGNGTCRVWTRITYLDGATIPGTPPLPGWNPTAGLNEITRAPDATIALPGDLTPLKLPAGRYKLSADSHDPLKTANCKGSATLEIQVGDKPATPPAPAARPGGGPAVGPAPAAPPTAQPIVAGPINAGSTSNTTATQRINGLALIPAAPVADQPIRVRVEGNGTCKVWFGIVQVGAPKVLPAPPVPGWNPLPTINELTRPADATLALPGDLTPLKLAPGRYKIGVSAHERLTGSNCTGYAELEVTVAEKPAVPIQPRPATGPLRAAPR